MVAGDSGDDVLFFVVGFHLVVAARRMRGAKARTNFEIPSVVPQPPPTVEVVKKCGGGASKCHVVTSVDQLFSNSSLMKMNQESGSSKSLNLDLDLNLGVGLNKKSRIRVVVWPTMVVMVWWWLVKGRKGVGRVGCSSSSNE
ncbi:hypothetical protein R6Q57_006081 [Mikania cordata]